MTWNLHTTHIQDGDLVLLVGQRHKHYIITLKAGMDFQTHRGVLKHDEIIGQLWGTKLQSHMGNPFYVFQPSLADVLREMPRNTQILYPKDIGFIFITTGVGPGSRVLEAGTGSGSLTTALAYSVGDTGQVYSYEVRKPMQKLAQKNLKRLGLQERVDFKLRDIEEGFDETDIDMLFLDVQAPHDYIPQARAAIRPGGFFASLVPTFNQVEKLLLALNQHNFAFIETCEIMLRYYKPQPARLRPTDRMIAHTGFLVFGRRVEVSETPDETPPTQEEI
ncbi:MAG: tRNA (adenine-N1)-methyltransferase [Anaerolineae bacterium]|jgi:tRNA (adenine57-N1/adenine58-N1)-methyltransferase catalytic subunit|nr:tRNA (adenine-N1)-methyltransferase [Anaerolineae bacterium]MBT7072754.1 tRNA (adenine-N1)-methyltransferase [Anaerolineae bacterium]MBT7324635.1 tRNA (adenine-N1)-methyltransferase [Anaerolineae bacterium]